MKVPMKNLYTGAQIPGIGLGTFGSDHVDTKTVVSVVREALKMEIGRASCRERVYVLV